MAAVERLMGLGMTAELAKRVGFFMQTPITAQESRTINGPGNQAIVVSNATASLILGTGFDIGDQVIVAAHTAVSLYPSPNEIIWPTSAGAVHAVSADVARMFMKFTASVWNVISSV